MSSKMQIFSLSLLLLLLSSSLAEDTNYLEEVTIRLKKEYGDYFKYTFEDKDIFFIEKISSPAVGDICSVINPTIETSSISAPTIDSYIFYVTDEKIFSLKGSKLTAYLVEESLGSIIAHPRGTSDLLELSGLPRGNTEFGSHNIIFKPRSRYFYVFVENSLAIFHEQSSGLILKTKITLTTIITKEDFDFAFISPNKLYILNKRTGIVSVNLILADSRFAEIKSISNVKSLFPEEDVIYFITDSSILQENYAKSSEKKAIMPSALFAEVEGRLFIHTDVNTKPEARIKIFDPLLEFDKTDAVINCPKGAKEIRSSKNNIFVIYDTWIRIYPMVGNFQFSSNFYYDFIQLDFLQDFLTIGDVDYIISKDRTDELRIKKLKRKPTAIECKKEQAIELDSYKFETKFWTTYCQANKDLFRFENGTCSFVQTVNISSDEGFVVGIWQLLLIFLAGALTGSTIYKFVSKSSIDDPTFNQFIEEPQKMPQHRKPINLNKNLHRGPPSRTNSSHLENRKFMSDFDDTAPSEEFRDMMMSPVEDKSKKPLQTFETPRFTFPLHGHGSHHASPAQNNQILNSEGKEKNGESSSGTLTSDTPVVYEVHETVTNLEGEHEPLPNNVQESFGDA